ncbi:MAG: hypothetical protein MAG715_01065 [Methanonatronarchaeales archaeon]|nr:hypothetical protein [Methanonatronarchaeales archaeon]
MKEKVPVREALLYERFDGRVRCDLCAHRCSIAPGERGICGVRENRGGDLYSLNYGKVSSEAVDPVEKKPLYHFHPGTRVMSFGTVGCNFRCGFCQNYRVSTAGPEDLPLRDRSPVEGVKMAEERGCSGVAYTYNEPVVWMEHALEGCREAEDRDLYTVFVTNGFFTPESVALVAPHLDAANVDVKAMDEDFYRKVTSSRLEPVLNSCEELYERGVHLELTYLVVPTKNDSEESLAKFADWVRDSLGPEVPVHFSRFHPAHLIRDLPNTPVETLEEAHSIAKESGLHYVYVGNVPGHEYEDTYCPGCGSKIINRSGFAVDVQHVDDGKCAECGREVDVVY